MNLFVQRIMSRGLTQVDFNPVGVPAGRPALRFVRDVVACIKESWWEYPFLADQRDNALAMLTILHVLVRCIIEPDGGDKDDAKEEVSPAHACVVSVLSDTEH